MKRQVAKPRPESSCHVSHDTLEEINVPLVVDLDSSTHIFPSPLYKILLNLDVPMMREDDDLQVYRGLAVLAMVFLGVLSRDTMTKGNSPFNVRLFESV